MRISDWSSDVCSSDLSSIVQPAAPAGAAAPESPRDTRRNPPRWSEGMLSLHHGDRDDAGIRALSVPAARLPAGRLYHPHGRTGDRHGTGRSEEHTSELQSLMRISYAVFCLKKKKN